MNISELYSIFEQHPIIVTDSRAIVPNCIYFSLKGDKFDGNTFAIEALKGGAAFSIIDNAEYAKTEKCILVNNCLETLQQLAHYHRKKLDIPILGITGSNGKTTSKELINAVLSKKFNTAATKGNLNNHIGVPLTLLSISKENNFAIVEMGANHIGEINALSNIADPDFGIITNIGKAHLEGFGSFEGVIQAKTELYKYISAKNGILFVNISNPILSNAVAECNCETINYSTNSDSFIKGEIESINPYLSVKIFGLNCLLCKEDTKIINTKLIGSYNIENVLAAVTIGMYFGVNYNDIKEAIENYTPSNNRSQLFESSKNRLLLDYYNANPTSMEAAITNFEMFDSESKPKIVILGDMFELGEYSESEHKRILMAAISKKFDKIIISGSEFKKVDVKNQTIAFNNSEELANWLKANPINGACILIKGSRGSKLENIVGEL